MRRIEFLGGRGAKRESVSLFSHINFLVIDVNILDSKSQGITMKKGSVEI